MIAAIQSARVNGYSYTQSQRTTLILYGNFVEKKSVNN